jgi:hypothetical protein
MRRTTRKKRRSRAAITQMGYLLDKARLLLYSGSDGTSSGVSLFPRFYFDTTVAPNHRVKGEKSHVEKDGC